MIDLNTFVAFCGDESKNLKFIPGLVLSVGIGNVFSKLSSVLFSNSNGKISKMWWCVLPRQRPLVWFPFDQRASAFKAFTSSYGPQLSPHAVQWCHHWFRESLLSLPDFFLLRCSSYLICIIFEDNLWFMIYNCQIDHIFLKFSFMLVFHTVSRARAIARALWIVFTNFQINLDKDILYLPTTVTSLSWSHLSFVNQALEFKQNLND